jgi:hypothetical protein
MTHRNINATPLSRGLPGLAEAGVPASTTTITTTGTTIPMVRTGVSS